MSDLAQKLNDVCLVNATMPFSDDGIKAPNSSDSEKPPKTESVPTMPGPGKVYKIWLRNTDRVITVTEGEVALRTPTEAQPGGGWYWVCVEEGPWVGFRNTVSGNFLSLNGKSGLHAMVAHCKAHQLFYVRYHPQGNCLLLVLHRWGKEMRHLGVAADGKTLIGKEKNGAHWVFEEVCEASVLHKERLPKNHLLRTAARLLLEFFVVMLLASLTLDCILKDDRLSFLFFILFAYVRA